MRTKMWAGLWMIWLLGMCMLGHTIVSMEFPITDFSQGVLSSASYGDVDASAAIRWYYVYILLGVPVLVFLTKKIFPQSSNILEKVFIKVDAFGNRHDEFVCYIVFLLVSMISGKSDFYSLLFVALLGFGFWFFKCRKEASCKGEDLNDLFSAWVMLVFSFSFAMLLSTFFFGKCACAVVSIIASVVLAYGLCKLEKCSAGMEHIHHALLPLAVCPVFLWLMVEVMYTLKLWGYDVCMFVLLVPYVCTALWSYYRWRCWKGGNSPYFYELAAIGVSLLGSVRGLSVWHVDFFEEANHGRAIFDWIMGYGLPILDNFDAHMMGSTVGGYLYYLVTGDVYGALSAPYAYWQDAVALFGVFFLLKVFIGPRDAFLFIAIFPIAKWASLSVGFILFAYWIYWHKHRNFFTDVLLAAIFIASCLYRLDIGSAFGVSLVITSFAYNISNDKYRDAARLLCACIITGGLFCLLAYFLGDRDCAMWSQFIQRFWQECSSNQNWAYGRLGKNAYMVYLVLPALAALLITYVKKEKDELFYWSIVFLSLAYIINIPRTMVRHSMVEQSLLTYGLITLILTLLVVYKMRFSRRIVLAGVLFALPFIVLWRTNWSGTNFFSHSAYVVQSLCGSQKTPAMTYAEDQNFIDSVRLFLDNNTEKDETYIDFTNQSLLYAFTGKKNPVYPNQSPGMVNAEKGQALFLEDIANVDVPFVFMPYIGEKNSDRGPIYSLDGILNTDRYYLITEYIGENYRPLCMLNEIAVWCRTEDYEKLQSSVEIQGWKLLGGYDYNTSNYYTHHMGSIPFLWGQYGKGNTSELSRISTVKAMGDSLMVYELPKVDKIQSCYLVMEIEAEQEEDVKLTLFGDGLSKQIEYSFQIREGKHFYRLRISSDILWYSKMLTTMRIELGSGKMTDIFFAQPEKVLGVT